MIPGKGSSTFTKPMRSLTHKGLWVNEDGNVVHPDAHAGGGGPGAFRIPGKLTHDPLEQDLPHPISPAARNLNPLAIRRAQQDLDKDSG